MTCSKPARVSQNGTVTQGIEDGARQVRGDRGGTMGTKRKDDGEPESGGNSRYDDELLSANWNPVIGLIEWSCAKTLEEVGKDGGRDLSEDEIDAFLDRIYTMGG